MKIRKDLAEYIEKNMADIAEGHLEAWKDRYFGYSPERLREDLFVNYDTRGEIESAEEELRRKLSDKEQKILLGKFIDQVVEEYVNWPFNH